MSLDERDVHTYSDTDEPIVASRGVFGVLETREKEQISQPCSKSSAFPVLYCRVQNVCPDFTCASPFRPCI
jgi:hypothetical protein